MTDRGSPHPSALADDNQRHDSGEVIMRIRTILAAAAVPAALAASLLGTTAASAAANPNAGTTGMTTCTTDGLGPSVITTNLNVPAGATCRLYGNEVKGNVSVQGSLVAFGATF